MNLLGRGNPTPTVTETDILIKLVKATLLLHPLQHLQ